MQCRALYHSAFHWSPYNVQQWPNSTGRKSQTANQLSPSIHAPIQTAMSSPRPAKEASRQSCKSSVTSQRGTTRPATARPALTLALLRGVQGWRGTSATSQPDKTTCPALTLALLGGVQRGGGKHLVRPAARLAVAAAKLLVRGADALRQ